MACTETKVLIKSAKPDAHNETQVRTVSVSVGVRAVAGVGGGRVRKSK